MLRKVGLLALCLALTLLVTGAAQARPLAGSTRASESGIVDRFWDWIEALFRFDGRPSSGQVHATWEAEGSHIDPNGGD